MGNKTLPQVGDRRYVVEWIDKLAFDDAGDLDRDNCRCRTRSFATKEEAWAFAKSVYPQDQLGSFVAYWLLPDYRHPLRYALREAGIESTSR